MLSLVTQQPAQVQLYWRHAVTMPTNFCANQANVVQIPIKNTYYGPRESIIQHSQKDAIKNVINRKYCKINW